MAKIRIRNSSKNPVIISHKSVEQTLGTNSVMAMIDGSYVAIESQRTARKVLDTTVIPGMTRMTGPGEIHLTKAEYAQLDESALRVFDNVLSIQEIKD